MFSTLYLRAVVRYPIDLYTSLGNGVERSVCPAV
jgi:hypothetical protein